jgi:hypothetical protein
VSLGDNPYWELPQGRLTLRFWIEGRTSSWFTAKIPAEGMVAIDRFFLVSLNSDDEGAFSPMAVHLACGGGDWNISHYDRRFARDLAYSEKPKERIDSGFSVPCSGYYRLWLPVLADASCVLKTVIKSPSSENKIETAIEGSEVWQEKSLGPVYLEEGEHSVYFENTASAKVMLEYFLLLRSRDKE